MLWGTDTHENPQTALKAKFGGYKGKRKPRDRLPRVGFLYAYYCKVLSNIAVICAELLNSIFERVAVITAAVAVNRDFITAMR